MAQARRRPGGLGAPLRLRPQRLALDVRADAIYWARAAGPDRLVAWGRFPRGPGESSEETLRRLAVSDLLRGRSVEVALRSPDAEHRRIDIPDLSQREGAAVGQRKAQELSAERAGDSTCDFEQAPGSAPRPLWLCAAPLPQVALLQEWWQRAGFELAAIASQHLALGHLAHLLPDLGDALVAVVDVEPEQANCVVADRRGWVFGRQIPLRFASDNAGEPAADEDGEEVLRLVSEEEGFTLAERVTTELERTLRYVQSVLGLGTVDRIVLGGEVASLSELGAALQANLDLPVLPLGDAISAGPGAGAEPSAALAIGVALGGGHLNLLPEAARAERARRAVTGRLRSALAACLAVVALGGLSFGGQLFWLQRQLGTLEEQWRASARERREGETSAAARRRAEVVESSLSELGFRGPSFVAALEALGRLAPGSAVVHELQIQPDLADAGVWRAELAVEATAESVSEAAGAVSQLARALDESPLFALDKLDRKPLPRGGRVPATGERVRFAIEARMVPVGGPVLPDAPGPGAGHG